jgi:hypothetical protein
MKWNLSVVLICMSFMTRYGENFFMILLAIWSSPFEKILPMDQENVEFIHNGILFSHKEARNFIFHK